MQVVVDNLLTHYDIAGDGPLVLMLHGWGDQLKTFDAIRQKLSKKHTIVRLDLPGFGSTEPPKDVWGLSDYAQFVGHFIDKLKLKAPDIIIGHSNGGAIAIVGLAEQSLQTKKLVLIASAGIRDRQSMRKLSFRVLAKLGKVVTAWLPRRTRQKLRTRLYRRIGSDMLVAPRLEETFRQIVARDIRPEARMITIPALLIYGDRDTATPLHGVGTALRDTLQSATLQVIKDADHFVHQTSASEVTQAITEFTS